VCLVAAAAWLRAQPAGAQEAVIVPVPAEELTSDVVLRAAPGEGQLVISRRFGDPDLGTETYEAFCMTPCRLRLPAGEHVFLAGDSHEFTVRSTGGNQQWLLEDDNVAGIVAGAIMTFAGPLGILPFGMLMGTIDEDLTDYGWGIIGAGAAVGLAGILIWVTSYGSAELVDPDDSPAAAGRRASGTTILPTVFAAPDERGRTAWGFGLTLAL
jgi:hypothetical protein